MTCILLVVSCAFGYGSMTYPSGQPFLAGVAGFCLCAAIGQHITVEYVDGPEE
jgi:hypothetical protein